MNLRKAYTEFISSLEKVYQPTEAATITEMVFESMLGIRRADVIRNPDQSLDADAMISIQSILEKLIRHMPVQYALGFTWFHHLRFEVNEHVLIPRPETEQLTEIVIASCKQSSGLRLLDIGTGSGCIPIAIKKNVMDLDVTTIDISQEALQVANRNATTHEAHIQLLQIDFLDEHQWDRLGVYDIIVSNPPYIPTSEKKQMEMNVVDYEPATALFVPDDDPLLFYRKISEFGKSKLKTGGVIFLETHEDFAQQTAALFAANDYQTDIIKDYFEKERFVKATHR